jgi:hypothetical protein
VLTRAEYERPHIFLSGEVSIVNLTHPTWQLPKGYIVNVADPTPTAYIANVVLSTWQLSTPNIVEVFPSVVTRPGYDEVWSDIFLESSFRRIGALLQLKSGWDSYGAEPISPVAANKAKDLLTSISAPLLDFYPRILPYAIVPMPNGGVQLEWKGAARDLEVEVAPDGKLSFLLAEGHGKHRHFREQEGAKVTDILRLVRQVLLL